jgi:HK97 family phage portal protein
MMRSPARLASPAPFEQKGSVEDWFSTYGYGGRTDSGVVVNQTTAMRVATVMACVRVCSEDVAKLPPRVYRLVGADGTRREAKDHFLYRIFRKPNAWQTWFEFCEMMQAALRMRGNAYAVVIRDGRGMPLQMIPVNPDRVSVYEAPGGFVFYQVARLGPHDMAVLESFPLLIPADDVFHLRWMASGNSLVALSPISYARETIGLALGQEMHAANLIGAGARPSGVLQTDKKLSKEVAERLAGRWAEIHGGAANSGKTAVLEEGLKWQQLTMSSVDLEFIAGRRLQAELICQIFRVAPFKVGITAGVSAKNIEQVQLQHYTDTVHPDLVRWEQKLQVFFDLDDDIQVEFDVAHLIRADLAARANAARVLGMSAVLTPDENRVSFGMNPMGDAATKLFMPANMVPIEEAGKNTMAGPLVDPGGPGSDQTGAPADGGDGDPAQLPDG